MPSLRPMKTFLMISIHSYYPQRREAFSTVWPMHFHQKCTEDAMSTNAHQCTIQEKRLFWVVMFVLQTILCVCTLYCFRNLQKICWWETEKLPWTNFLTLVFLSLPNTARSITSLISCENEPLQNTELQFWGLKIRAKGRPHQWTAEKKSSFCSPSFCASLLFSISSFSVLLGNSVIFPSSTLQRTARLCKRGQNCKRGTAGKSTVVALVFGPNIEKWPKSFIIL